MQVLAPAGFSKAFLILSFSTQAVLLSSSSMAYPFFPPLAYMLFAFEFIVKLLP